MFSTKGLAHAPGMTLLSGAALTEHFADLSMSFQWENSVGNNVSIYVVNIAIPKHI